MPAPTIYTRHLEEVVGTQLATTPVVVLNGARTVGKSTLLHRCAATYGVAVVDLDDLATRQAVAADPALFAAGTSPVCIDEFQQVLPLLGAIKAELNRNLHPGRYLLTGSTRYVTLPATSQSLTGRAHIIDVWPLSQGELRGTKEGFLDGLLSDPGSLVTPAVSPTTRQDYEQMVLRGGFPLAVASTGEQQRRDWFRSFIRLVIARDVLEIRRIRHRHILPRVLQRLAAQSAQVLNATAIANAIAEPVRTIEDYIALLEAVFLVHRIDAYGRTLGSRVRGSPKVHLVDSGLGAHLLGITQAKLATRDPAVLTEFGHLVETFAVNEVIKQSGWSAASVVFSHYRTRDVEADLVCEDDDGHVAAIEIKASDQIPDKDFNGLRSLRDKLGTAFVGGVVLYLGSRSYTREERIHVLPMDRLWS
ncbi:MAG TPA: ATP-binding protein [Chloroflexota bacterium]|nr:ATP-binding protein [Chloroflexota bacterium]